MKRVLLIIVIFCLTALVQVVSSQNKTRQAKTTVEENKAIVRGYLNEILNEGNLAAFDSYFDDNVVFNGSGGFQQHIAGMLKSMRAAFPDFRVTIEDQIGEGDKVASRVTFHGTHKGEFRGIPPSGRQVTYTGIAIDRIRDGKVVEMWHEANTLKLLQQVGAISRP